MHSIFPYPFFYRMARMYHRVSLWCFAVFDRPSVCFPLIYALCYDASLKPKGLLVGIKIIDKVTLTLTGDHRNLEPGHGDLQTPLR